MRKGRSRQQDRKKEAVAESPGSTIQKSTHISAISVSISLLRYHSVHEVPCTHSFLGGEGGIECECRRPLAGFRERVPVLSSPCLTQLGAFQTSLLSLSRDLGRFILHTHTPPRLSLADSWADETLVHQHHVMDGWQVITMSLCLPPTTLAGVRDNG